jgi:hypothetical protein
MNAVPFDSGDIIPNEVLHKNLGSLPQSPLLYLMSSSGLSNKKLRLTLLTPKDF